jgi:hypothetical protein
MFKVGDRVRVIATQERLRSIGIPNSYGLDGKEVEVKGINDHDDLPVITGDKSGTVWYFAEKDLELVEAESVPPMTPPTWPITAPTGTIRTFDSGATRDTDQGKLNYVKALSPIVLQRYVEYLGKHRLQLDGSLRDWNNWKQGIPQQTYFESIYRHLHATWLLRDGFEAADNHGSVTVEDSLCGILFNAMGLLHEILKEKTNA